MLSPTDFITAAWWPRSCTIFARCSTNTSLTASILHCTNLEASRVPAMMRRSPSSQVTPAGRLVDAAPFAPALHKPSCDRTASRARCILAAFWVSNSRHRISRSVCSNGRSTPKWDNSRACAPLTSLSALSSGVCALYSRPSPGLQHPLGSPRLALIVNARYAPPCSTHLRLRGVVRA